jgi:glycosyltransferase involved in cell wall biosynthesis
MTVTVAVATFGDLHWETLAQHRAIPSAQRAGAERVLHEHGQTLHAARNALLDRVDTPFIIYLDADDELEPGYVHAMAGASGDVRVPRVRYARTHARGPALMPRVAGHRHTCDAACLAYGNWIVVGACARTDLLRKVGGWLDFPWSEDWSLWLRCWQAGADIRPAPAAVYRAHVRADSRNRGQTPAVRLEAHRAIARAHGVPVP